MTYDIVLFAILYSFIFVFGIIGNLAITIFFGFKTKRDTSFRWFIIQLSIADCLCCGVTPFFWAYLQIMDQVWHLGTFVCKAFMPVGSLTTTVSAWILCGIAYERYRAIVCPLKHRLTKKQINLFGLVVWSIGFISSIPFFMSFTLLPYDDSNTNTNGTQSVSQNFSCVPVFTPEQQFITGLMTLVIQSLIPIIIMATFFIIIQSALHKRIAKTSVLLSKQSKVQDCSCSYGRIESFSRNAAEEVNDSNRFELVSKPKTEKNIRFDSDQAKLVTKTKQGTRTSREKDALNTLRVTVLVFILCSFPYNVFYVVGVYMFRFNGYNLQEMINYGPQYSRINLWLSLLVVLNSVMNCFIYAGKYPAFRKYLVSLLPRQRRFQDRPSISH